MKTKNAVVGIVLAAAIGIAAWIYFDSRGSVSLVARDTVAVYATIEDAMASPLPKPIAELAPQQRVSILQCVDVKHYQLYRVRLPNDRTGYVNAGNYQLLDKAGAPSSC
jgi:hypothetical protein